MFTPRHLAVAGAAAVVVVDTLVSGCGGAASPQSAATSPAATATSAATESPISSPSPTTGSPSATAKPSPRATKKSPKPTASKTSAKASAKPTTSGGNAVVAALLQQINKARAAEGLAPYTLSSGLTLSARRHTLKMAGSCGLEHQCPGEAGLGDRITAAGVHWSSVGENIGEGGPIATGNAASIKMAEGLIRSMLAEKAPNDGHRRNILSSSFHHTGISVYRSSSGTLWLTEDFSN